MAVGIVLGVAAVTKFRDPAHVAQAMRSLRIPGIAMHRVVGWVLPSVELVLAATLLVGAGEVLLWASGAAVLLLVAYLVVILRAVGFAEPVTCGCFGALGLGLVTWRTVIRNLALVALAGFALALEVAAPYASAGWVARVFLVATVALVLVAGYLSADVPPEPGRKSGEGREPTQASLGETVRVQLTDGREVAVLALVGQRPALFVHLSLSCDPCRRLVEPLHTWAATVPALQVICVMPLLDPRTPPRLAAPLIPVFDTRGEFAAAMPQGTPAAVLVGTDGLVAAGPLTGTDAIRQLVDEIAEDLGGEPLGPLPQPQI